MQHLETGFGTFGTFGLNFHGFFLCTRAGHGLPAAGLGDHTGLERSLGHVEVQPVCHAADGEHGGNSPGHVQTAAPSPKTTEGLFHSPQQSSTSSKCKTQTSVVTNILCFQGKNWDIVGFSKDTINKFKRVIPLISNLKNPSLRDRSCDGVCVHLTLCVRSDGHTNTECADNDTPAVANVSFQALEANVR